MVSVDNLLNMALHLFHRCDGKASEAYKSGDDLIFLRFKLRLILSHYYFSHCGFQPLGTSGARLFIQQNFEDLETVFMGPQA